MAHHETSLFLSVDGFYWFGWTFGGRWLDDYYCNMTKYESCDAPRLRTISYPLGTLQYFTHSLVAHMCIFWRWFFLIRLTIQVRKKHYRHLENDPEISRDHIFPNHRPMLQTPRMISERWNYLGIGWKPPRKFFLWGGYIWRTLSDMQITLW